MKDYKTLFQEEVQLLSKSKVTYNSYAINDQDFKSEVIYDGIIFGTGIGKSKSQAEEEAAKVALAKLIK
ncbi:putative dsRNA-binding protein [Mycoplasmopsis felifaucium]|uniref:putative dsRNA-binding protein n=1 Tax=Mycoplasmopsis felifaucium TaxID=35768 RepID=UPI002FE6A98E